MPWLHRRQQECRSSWRSWMTLWPTRRQEQQQQQHAVRQVPSAAMTLQMLAAMN